MWLKEKEVADLTRRKQPRAQAAVLLEAGIPFSMVDGRPIVLKDDMFREKPKGRLVLN
jgi:hypothetical protein